MSIQLEIDSDPTLKNWMERKMDYDLLDHQVNLKLNSLKIALSRSLNKVK